MDARQSIPLIDPPSDPCSLGTDFLDFLQQFQQFESTPYVHPKAISFNDAAHRANWIASMQDAIHRDTLPEFYNAKKNGKKCWIGFFSGETVNWIENPSWATEPWHCFTIAIIQDSIKGNTWWSSIQTHLQTQNQAREQQLYSRDYNETYSSGYARTKQNASAYGIQLINPKQRKSSAYFIHYTRYRRWQQWEIRAGKVWKTYELRTVLKLNMSKYKGFRFGFFTYKGIFYILKTYLIDLCIFYWYEIK